MGVPVIVIAENGIALKVLLAPLIVLFVRVRDEARGGR